MVLAVPSAALASWSGKGVSEPNTVYDVTDGWMFQNPDVSPCTTAGCGSNQVYMVSFLEQSYGLLRPGDLNPNAAVAGTGLLGTDVTFTALYGVWKDCNQDGVIGLGENGVLEYRSEVLANTFGNSICPVTPTPNPIPTNWMPSHNDGQWVREFLPFAYDNSSNDQNPYNINLLGTGTKVWGDFGLPTPIPAGSGGCPILPPQYGWDRSTGGALTYVDCLDGFAVTHSFDTVADNNTALQPYSFSDSSDPQQSHSQANVANPWGQESDASDAQVWDCSQPVTTVSVTDPTGTFGTLEVANFSQPAVPPGVATDGSAAGTANATGAGFDRCNRSSDSVDTFSGGAAYNEGGPVAAANQVGGSPHWGQDLASTPYAYESPKPTGQVSVVYKQSADDNLAPISDVRPDDYVTTGDQGICQPLLIGCQPVPATLPTAGAGPETVFGPSTPDGLGLDFLGLESAAGGSLWSGYEWRGGTAWLIAPTAIQYITMYASLDPATIAQYHLSLPKTTYGNTLTIGTYGAEACGSFTSGDHGGWDCDASNWNQATQQSTPNGIVPNAAAGDAYELRDITCYDESATALRGQGISIGSVPTVSVTDPTNPNLAGSGQCATP